MPRSRRSSQKAGSTAQKKGQDFEDRVQRYVDDLNAAGFCYIQKTYQQTKRIRGSWRPVGKGPYDWFGVLWTGHLIAFETKRRERKNKYTWAQKDMHQLDALRQVRSISPIPPAFVLMAWEWEGYVVVTYHDIDTIPDSKAPVIKKENGIRLDYINFWPIIEDRMSSMGYDPIGFTTEDYPELPDGSVEEHNADITVGTNRDGVPSLIGPHGNEIL